MAGDATPKSEPKQCCAALEKKLSKIEMGRAALKEAIALMDKRITEMETEKLNLKKECKQEQMRAELEREAKEKESHVRIELEKEICDLKSEIASLQKRGCSEHQVEEGDQLLQTCVLELEAEIKRLKELVKKETKRGDSEKKKAEAEKKKAAEALKLVKAEKSNAEKEKKHAEIERKEGEECKRCFEALKLEANEAKMKLISEKSKVEETNRKVEAERQRADREKKRADLEATKAEEQRKHAEVERRKAMNEKIHSDQLSRQLEEERQRKEALQKEMQEILSGANRAFLCSKTKNSDTVLCNDDEKAETSDKKVLHEQLKLEKMQRRRAKRISKLEKVRNNLLKQELNLLKQDAIQFSRRLKMLDECVSQGIEGIGSLPKIHDSSNQQPINSNNRISGIEVCDLHCQNENELIKTRYTATDAFDHLKPTREYMRNLLSVSGLSCTEPISGTNSEMESLIGGSVRSKSQNSAICSTSTSFSDRQLMGSQGRGVSPIISSARLEEESSKQGLHSTRLSGEVTKMRINENDWVVTENDRSHLTLYSKSQLVDKLPGHSGKRKKIQAAQESFLYLHSEDKLNSRTGKPFVHDVSGLKNKVPATICSQSDENFKLSGNGKHLVSQPLDDLHVKKCKTSKKRKVALEQMPAAHPFHQNNEQKQIDHLEVEDIGDVRFCTGASPTAADRTREIVHACGDGAIDAGKSDMDATICFEGIFGGDVMKLLELDDEADEERYRIAMERPLSPTLPEINFHELGGPQVDDFNYLVEGGNSRGLSSGQVNLLPSQNVDAVDVKIDSNNYHLLHGKEHTASFCRPSTSVVQELMSGTEKCCHYMDAADCASSLSKLRSSSPNPIQAFQEGSTQSHGINILAIDTVPTAWEKNNAVQGIGFNQSQVESEHMEFKDLSVSRCLNARKSSEFSSERQKNVNHVPESDAVKEAGKSMPISVSGRMGFNYFGNVEVKQGSVTKYCIVPSNEKDEGSISRTICAIESFHSESSMVYAKRWMVGDVLLALAHKQDLLLKEKACVFFSLLLHNVVVMTSTNSKSHKADDFSFCPDSFATEVNQVVADVQTRRLFLELCECKLLFSIIEDFLIDRTVLAYVDVLHTPLLSSDSGSRVLLLGGRTMLISSKPATFNQLEIGGLILASVCTAANDVGFICEASYNILRICKNDLSWILRVLHIFACVCGQKYFAESNCSCIMATIKSVVLVLEGGEKSVGLVSSHSLSSARDIRSRLPPCVQCPFTEGAVCIDQVFALLLGKLEEYANSIIRCQYPKEPHISTVGACQAQRKSIQGSLENVNGVDGPKMGLCASDYLFMDKSVDILKADFMADWTSSHFSDIISLVELISCYMDWDWLYNNIVPSLLKLLASHVPEEFFAAVLILIGQVGRLGIDTGGYDQIGVEGLRCSLSAFLDQNTTSGRGLSSQFAAAKALIDLLPFEVEELMEKDLEILIESSQSNHVNVIKKWFTQLNEEQQSFCISLFQSAIVQSA